MKKLISTFLVLVMLLSLLCGCGGNQTSTGTEDDADEEVTLYWAMPWSEQSDFSMVQDKVNELLATLLPNTKIEFILDSSMASKWSLWMAGKKVIDIANSGYATDLQSEINKKAYLPLNELVDKYAPTIKEEWESSFKDNYLTGMYGDTLYAIPNNQYHIKETSVVVIPEALTEYMDIEGLVQETYANPTTTEKVYQIFDDYLKKIKEAGVIDTDTISTVIDIDRLYTYVAKRGYEFIGGVNSNICYKVFNDGKVEMIDFHTTDEFKIFYQYASKWFQEGYISQDILTGGGSGNRQYTLQAVSDSRIDMDETQTRTRYDGSVSDYRRYISINNPEDDYSGATVMGSLSTYNSIPTTSAHPARAMKLLELLRTEEGAPLLNMICYGLEGTHYNMNDDGTIDPIDYDGQATSNNKYGIPNWLVGSLFNAYIVNPPYTSETLEYGRNYYENVLPTYKKTPVYGLSFDCTEVSNELAQMASINTEFEKQLVDGVLADTESAYNTMMSRMETAGINKVIESFQNQADEYMKQ